MQQDVKTNKTLSWYVYFTLVMIFISPILLYELLGIATGMVTRGEYMEVLKNENMEGYTVDGIKWLD